MRWKRGGSVAQSCSRLIDSLLSSASLLQPVVRKLIPHSLSPHFNFFLLAVDVCVSVCVATDALLIRWCNDDDGEDRDQDCCFPGLVSTPGVHCQKSEQRVESPSRFATLIQPSVRLFPSCCPLCGLVPNAIPRQTPVPGALCHRSHLLILPVSVSVFRCVSEWESGESAPFVASAVANILILIILMPITSI